MSDPADLSATATASGTSGTASTITPAAGGHTKPKSSTKTANEIIFPLTFTADSGWLVDLILDDQKGNWEEWDRRLRAVCDQHGFRRYLNGTMPRPDETHWDTCDIALKGFILLHISNHDYELAEPQPTAQLAYSILRDKYQNEGAFAKIKIVRDMLDTLCLPGVPKCWTFDHIAKLQSKFLKMGKLTDNQYLSIYVLNSMHVHFPRIQTSINDMLANPLTTSADIRKRLYQEDLLESTEATTEAALMANSTKPSRPLCSNCKNLGHRVKYCIKPGGRMAGKTLAEAHAAQDLARGKTRTGRTNANTANTASTKPAPPAASNNSTQTIVIN